MALIHWWPLNGEKSDHAGNLDLTSSSTTFVDGRLGKALQLNSVIAKVVNPFIGLDNWSLSFWLMDNGSSAWSDFLCFSKNLVRIELDNATNWRWYVGEAGTGATYPETGHLFGSGTIINAGAKTSTWYHVIIVKQDTKAKLYINGTEKTSTTGAKNFTDESAYMYFNSRANETTSSKMSVCDVRCYDHPLSLTEMHTLGNSMLLHYNFEDYTGSVNLKTDPNNWTSSYSCDGSGATKGSFSVQSDGSVLVTDNNTNTRFYSSQKIPVKAGDKLTFSIKYKLVSGTGETFRWQISEWNASGTRVKLWWSQDAQKVKDLGDGWKLYYYHLTIGASDAAEIRFYLQDGADYTNYTHSYYLRDFKLEKGHTDNPIFETTEYLTEYDCSGNEYNATVNGVQNGVEAATGAHSAYFLDGGQWLEHTGAPFSSSTLSVAFWWKSSCTAAKTGYHIPFAIDGGRVEISIPNNGQLRWGGYINGARQCNNVTCKNASGTTFSLNNGEWHHIVSVFDGTGFLGYVDGIYQGKQGGSGTITYTSKTLRIGKYNSGATSDYGATDAYISDVKVYNSVLALTDIERLYKHTVKITPEQNLIGEYFIEEGLQENIEFLSTPYKTGGWGGTTAIENNELILTATNGWHSFVWLTPERFKTKNAVLSFEYCFMDKEGWSDGVWVHTTSSTAQYLIGSGPKVYNTDIGTWTSISLPLTNLTDYIGWTLRGADGKGKKIIMRIRNPRLLVDKTNVKVQPTGTIKCNGLNQIENVRIESHGLVTATDFIEQ